MARVGNEAKLILRLAKQEMDARCARLQEGGSNQSYKMAVGQYYQVLDNIIKDLEHGK